MLLVHQKRYNRCMSKIGKIFSPRIILLFCISLGFFLAFVLFSYLVHQNLFTQIDFNTTVKIQDRFSHRFDFPFSLLSLIGNFEISSVILAIILFFRKKIWGVVVFIGFAVFHVIEIFGKTFVDHNPPPEFMVRTIRDIQMSQFHVRVDNSYPSGHAGRATFITLILFFIIMSSKRLSSLQKTVLIGCLIIYDIIMFVSRIYLGEHWVTDVIGGIVLAASLAFLSALAI